jgi:cobalt-zinc-cadmium efflux system outer membrane protein
MGWTTMPDRRLIGFDIGAFSWSLLLSGTLVLNGCRSPLTEASYDTWRDRDPATWQITDGGVVHDEGTLRTRFAEAGQAASPEEPVLTTVSAPDDYVRIALARNPSILAAERKVQRLGERIPQVTSLDDPMVQVAPFGEMAETAAGQVGLMTSLAQRLPFPGKLATRGAIAEQDRAMALADLAQTQLQVIAETRRTFWSYYFATRALETTRESRVLLSQFEQIAEAEYKAGQRSQPDVLRASVELSNLDNELITLHQRQLTARSMLNQLMDRPIDAPLPEPRPIELEQIAGHLDELLALAARHNPSLRRILERIDQSRKRQKLARLNRWPDLTVSVSFNLVQDEGLSMAANGDDQWWLGFGMNVPIWGEKHDAAEREALQSLLEGVADLTAQRNRVAFQVEDAYLRAEAQQKLVRLFRDVIIPQARQTVEASASGYRAGSVDFLTLVDNWRKLLNFDLMYHRALSDTEQAVADLERVVGQEVARQGTAGASSYPVDSMTDTRTPPASSEEQQ